MVPTPLFSPWHEPSDYRSFIRPRRRAAPITRVPALWIFLGLVGGLALGLGLAFAAPAALPPILAVAGPLGDLWLRALRATILPLVVALLFTGVVQTVAAARAGAMARRALAWFMVVLVGGSAMAGLFTPRCWRWCRSRRARAPRCAPMSARRRRARPRRCPRSPIS
jgi:hypothetical protein